MKYNLIQQFQKLWKSQVDDIEDILWLVGCVFLAKKESR